MSDKGVSIRLKASPDARLVPEQGDQRHVDFHLRVDDRKVQRDPVAAQRPSISLALVIDRSGSMHGAKVETAKHAALQVLNQLTDRDRASLVVFDDRIDVLCPAAPVTPQLRDEMRSRLAGVAARGSTALHEGWLTGAQTIADDGKGRGGAPARVLLLTDGMANVGKTDPEAIAAEAAQVYRDAGVATSTFGIGVDYDEALLGPMAVAGGGQFHHLRTPDEIIATFGGELGALLDTAVTQVSLELAVGSGTGLELVSTFWGDQPSPNALTVQIGDLPAGEERHVVVSLTLPPGTVGSGREVRARVSWVDDGGPRRTEWQTVRFTYTTEANALAEQPDSEVLRQASLHQSARARQQAAQLRKEGRGGEARDMLYATSATLSRAARFSPAAASMADDLDALGAEMVSREFSPEELKEMRFRNQNLSRGQRDLRRRKGPEEK